MDVVDGIHGVPAEHQKDCVGSRWAAVDAHVAMGKNGAASVDAVKRKRGRGIEPAVWHGLAFVINASVEVGDLRCEAGDEVFVSPFGAGVDDCVDTCGEPGIEGERCGSWLGRQVPAGPEVIGELGDGVRVGGWRKDGGLRFLGNGLWRSTERGVWLATVSLSAFTGVAFSREDRSPFR